MRYLIDTSMSSQSVTTREDKILKSQFVTSSWGGQRYLPYAFTEQTFLKDFLKEKHAELTERQRDIVLLVADNFLITNADLGKRLRVSDRTIRTDTSILQEAGILLRRNGRKRGQWQIVLPNGK